MSQALVRRLKERDSVWVNGLPAPITRGVRAGDRVDLFVPPQLASIVEPQPVPLDIIFEDRHVLVVVKPAGQLVHPAGVELSGTLANGVAHHLITRGEPSAAGAVTRLDRLTTGLVLFAKHPHAHHRLTESIRRGEIHRKYVGICQGSPKADRFTVDLPIARSPGSLSRREVNPSTGQRALTHARVLERFVPRSGAPRLPDGAALLEFELETGRTHQIRVHMAHIEHPLLGDPLYGAPLEGWIERQALHARSLEFPHPIDGDRHAYEIDLPEDMSRILRALSVKEESMTER